MKIPDYRWPLIAIVALCAGGALAQQTPPRITQPIEESVLVVLPGNTHPLARPEYDQGPAPVDLQLARLLLLLKGSPEQGASLGSLIDAQTDHGSPNYHKWLKPEEFGEQFGPAQQDLDTITAWLVSHGFVINSVANGRRLIEFSGTAQQVQETFHAEIHKYVVGGAPHWANASDPKIPAALAPVVAGIVSLHNFFPRHADRESPRAAVRPLEVAPPCSVPDGHCLLPGDYWTIYNEIPLIYGLYGSPIITGSGVTIAIAGRADVLASDVSAFRTSYVGSGYSGSFRQITNGPDPGEGGSNDQKENTMDVEWASAVAPGASVTLVSSASTSTTSGDELSELYIVDNNLAPVMSASYTDCEQDLGTAGNAFFNELWAQAAAQGITVVVAAGDSGSADCDAQGSSQAQLGFAASGIASTPYNIAAGGTMFVEGTGSYWNSVPSNYPAPGTTALSYIPENTWNESNVTYWSGIEAGGGGASSCVTVTVTGNGATCSAGYPQPSWQSGVLGVPQNSARDLPDIALAAGIHDSNIVYLNGAATWGGGTSFAAPAFAGIMALVNEATGSRQGLANPTLYGLGASEFGASGNPVCNASAPLPGNTCIFNDITQGSNAVPCISGSPECSSTTGELWGYFAQAGYDLTTGLGSINIYQLVNQWDNVPPRAACTATLTLNPNVITTAGTTTLNATVTSSGGSTPTGIIVFSFAGFAMGAANLTGSGSTSTATLVLSGAALRVGKDNLTSAFGGDAHTQGCVSAPVSVTVSAAKSNLTTTAATSVTGSAAVMGGTVNPRGASGTYGFEWGTDPAITFAESCPISSSPTSCPSWTANSTQQSVSYPLAGLPNSTTYYYRMVGFYSKNGAYEYGAILSFTTGKPPAVQTTAASGITGSAAVLNGMANPKGANGQYQFQWSTDPTLATNLQTSCNGLGYDCPTWTANSTTQSFTFPVTGLPNSTTYYFRLAGYDVDNNSLWNGAILSFTTQ